MLSSHHQPTCLSLVPPPHNQPGSAHTPRFGPFIKQYSQIARASCVSATVIRMAGDVDSTNSTNNVIRNAQRKLHQTQGYQHQHQHSIPDLHTTGPWGCLFPFKNAIQSRRPARDSSKRLLSAVITPHSSRKAFINDFAASVLRESHVEQFSFHLPLIPMHTYHRSSLPACLCTRGTP